MSLFVRLKAQFSRRLVTPIHRVHLTIFRSIHEISSRGTGRLRHDKHRPTGLWGVRGSSNVVSASWRTRLVVNNSRAFGDCKGGGYPRGYSAKFCENALSQQRILRRTGHSGPETLQDVIQVSSRAVTPLFLNFFSSSAKVSELSTLVVRSSLKRKRDMSYTEPLWEINGNQTPVSPRMNFARRNLQFYLRYWW